MMLSTWLGDVNMILRASLTPLFVDFESLCPLSFIAGPDGALVSETTRCAHKASVIVVEMKNLN